MRRGFFIARQERNPRRAEKSMDERLKNIPRELKERRQWVVWKTAMTKNGPSKVPFQVNGEKASTTNPKTWTTFSQAVEALESGRYEGIGFVFAKDDPYCGIDLDKCIDGQGRLSIEAEAVISMFSDGAYIEYSPSGRGIHLITKGTKPGPRCRNREMEFEIYTEGRYFTITGNLHKNSSPIKEQQAQIDEFYRWVFPQKSQKKVKQMEKSTELTPSQVEDGAVIRTISRSENAEKFQRLMMGDTSDYLSQSEADLAFVSILAFYTQDPEQIARIWRTSGLQRDKLDRDDYVNRTISMALGTKTSVYSGKHKEHSKVKTDIPYIEYLRDPKIAIRLMELMGVQVEQLGQEFTNPIDQSRKAALFLPHNEGFITMVSGEMFIPLPDLYAAHVKGEYKPLGTGERALWWIRFLVDEGHLKAPKILAKPLPEDAPTGAKKLYEGFIRLLEIRTLYNAEQTATPYSWRFAEGWTGTTRWETQQGMNYLLQHKYLETVGKTTSRTNLFELGPASKQANNEVEEATDSSAIKMSIPDEAIFFFHDIEEVEELYKQHQVMRKTARLIT